MALGAYLFLLAQTGKKTIDGAVESYRTMVAESAKEQGLEEYVDILLAIMQVESRGRGDDVMQSSESAGLARNSLQPQESVDQACIYFKELLGYQNRYSVDFNSVIQAYNYGPDYLRYVRDNGGAHTPELAEAFARERSGGKRVLYLNPVALLSNGGWRYAYGNMFYVKLVEQYI